MILRGLNPGHARVISVIAGTIIALACGTNYVYSAWAPQFAQKLKLSSTQSNLIGTFGNLGMYATGIPGGMLVDAKGPRWGVALGAIFFAVGYYPIAKAYDAGPGVYSVATLCLFSFLTGAGSATAFTASIKASALNYPESRGTATAFPLSAFGLSAFFFATTAQAFPHSTSNFLLLLATGTFVLPVLAFPFLRVIPTESYQHLSHHERQALHRRKSSESGNSRGRVGNNAQDGDNKVHSSIAGENNEQREDESEISSLITGSSSIEDDLESSKHSQSDRIHEDPQLDVRGFALLPLPEFWLLFSMLGLLTGIGLMTINNIGNDAQALWRHYDSTIDPEFIEKRQVMHVSILSFCSFLGRLVSGIGSDILASKFNRSRFWCPFISAVIFSTAQLVATAVEDPHYLFFVSGLTGLAYGVLFGVFPSLVAHAFGVNGLSQNWGTMTLAPVVCGNIFNLIYGRIYDNHSKVNPNGELECLMGRECYTTAYWVTFAAAVGGIVLCLWSIRHENEVHKENEKDRRRSDHDRIA